MASPARRLTDLAIRNLKAKPTRQELPDGGQRGLYLIIHPTGRRSFCCRYQFNGVSRKLTLKSGLSLADARKAAADAMYMVEQGQDPRETRKAQRLAQADTVWTVCESFIKREGKRLRTVAQMQRALKRLVYPALGDKLVVDIKRSDINKVLDQIEDTRGARSAELALQYLRRVLGWHAVQRDDFHNPIIRGMSRYSESEHRRNRILDDDEIRAVWQATESGNAFCALVRFLLLTGCRRMEAGGMTWAEISGNAWLLPASRHKNKTDLLRPLSKEALAVIAARPRIKDSQFIFTNSGQYPVHLGRGKSEFDQQCALAGWRLHDIRRTSRTLLSRAGVSADTAERCLGHALPAIRGTYDKHSYFHEMETAFEALSRQIHLIVNPSTDTVVTPLRREKN
jgi:integrase